MCQDEVTCMRLASSLQLKQYPAILIHRPGRVVIRDNMRQPTTSYLQDPQHGPANNLILTL